MALHGVGVKNGKCRLDNRETSATDTLIFHRHDDPILHVLFDRLEDLLQYPGSLGDVAEKDGAIRSEKYRHFITLGNMRCRPKLTHIFLRMESVRLRFRLLS